MLEYILFLVALCISIYIIIKMIPKRRYRDHDAVILVNPNNNVQIMQEYSDDEDNNNNNNNNSIM